VPPWNSEALSAASRLTQLGRIVLLLALVTVCPGAEEFSRWHEVELRLSSSATVSDPYRADPVSVRFNGPSGESMRVVAFSDDGRAYRVRTALGTVGDWRWEIASAPSAAKFDAHAGTVRITPNPPDDLTLRQRGFLRVSDDGRYLTYDDCTPFFWLADTAWNALWRTTPDEWEEYLRHRAHQGFSVILAHATHSKSVTEHLNRDGLSPFQDGLPVPAYWDALDRKILRANALGFVVLLVGVGQSSSVMWRKETTEPAFARYIGARLSGSFVVFSPSMDIRYAPENDVMGRALAEVAPRQLRTQHVGTDLPAALAYAASDYMSFAGLQSGHANGDIALSRAHVHDWLPAVQARAAGRPTLNLEAMYDRNGPTPSPAWRRFDARQLGYLSWLCGSPGYTYGTEGVWKWTPSDQKNSRRESLDWESAQDMTRLRAFFESLPWWDLRPASGALQAEPEPIDRRGALAANRDRSLVVAFLPGGDGLTIVRAFVPPGFTGTWFDPTTGERIAAAPPKAVGDLHWHFAAPTPTEWLLVLRTGPLSPLSAPR